MLLFEVRIMFPWVRCGNRNTHTGSEAMRKKKSNTAHMIMKNPSPLLYSAMFVPKALATPKLGVMIALKLA